VLSFSLRSPLTEPPSVIDVAYWPFAADVASYLFGSYRSNSGHAGRTDAHSKGANDPKLTLALHQITPIGIQ
jgi:hypothetical protein